MKYCFGIDIGGTTVKIGLFSASSEMLARWEIPTRKDSSPDGLLRDVKTALEGCLTERGISRTDVLGVGITAPGPVTEDGILHGTVNIGWGDVALGKEAEKILQLGTVRIGNDARVAALGEYAYGAGKGSKSMLMITLGTGVGGGVIQDGHILTGFHGVAGEIDHRRTRRRRRGGPYLRELRRDGCLRLRKPGLSGAVCVRNGHGTRCKEISGGPGRRNPSAAVRNHRQNPLGLRKSGRLRGK